MSVTEVTFASVPSPGQTNEDLIVAGGQYIIVLDGATAPLNVATGCIHDVAWLVAHLGYHLNVLLSTRQQESLMNVLAGAIEAVRQDHAATCDLANPDSPSCTVAILREHARSTVDYLVLGDSAVAFETTQAHVIPITDDRTDHLPDYQQGTITKYRNHPDGFWVASTIPEAATHSLTGTLDRTTLRRAAVLTDGATRLVSRYGQTWRQLLEILDKEGPMRLVEYTRQAESRTPAGRYRGKAHDDATAALCRYHQAV
jgi:hypothetical protein